MKTIKEYQFQFIKGIGPKRAKILADNGLETPSDILNYFPKSYIERLSVISILDLTDVLLKQSHIFNNDFDRVNDLKIKNEYTIIAKVIEKREQNFARGKKLLTILIIVNKLINN